MQNTSFTADEHSCSWLSHGSGSWQGCLPVPESGWNCHSLGNNLCRVGGPYAASPTRWVSYVLRLLQTCTRRFWESRWEIWRVVFCTQELQSASYSKQAIPNKLHVRLLLDWSIVSVLLLLSKLFHSILSISEFSGQIHLWPLWQYILRCIVICYLKTFSTSVTFT
jgi:hypothetical protein